MVQAPSCSQGCSHRTLTSVAHLLLLLLLLLRKSGTLASRKHRAATARVVRA